MIEIVTGPLWCVAAEACAIGAAPCVPSPETLGLAACGHELEGTTPRPIRTVGDLQVPDEEFQNFVNEAKTSTLTDEELADTVLDVGINWEHFVASNDNLLIPEHPLKITDVLMQEKIDSLNIITEAFVREVNLRSIEKKTGTKGRQS